MFGRKQVFNIPAKLPTACPSCGGRVSFTAVTAFDSALRAEKVDHYEGRCAACGQAVHYDGRGQRVEPALPNLPPDLSEVAQSPQGLTPYAGFKEFFAAEKAKAAELAEKQKAKAAAPAPAES
ncbi:MAG TPA: hypothetical protein VG245_03780 [Candidatus Dormibacteraeota bacterium]|jgi:DNA-directed RNA polymerase subunit RPC12/RpoP|nr:hypothetical protein [Candidatus Dormibacteraeota bacterium]